MSSFDKELPKEKIAAILQKIEGQAKVEVIETEVSPGTEKGDNFSGLVLAVDAKAKVDGVAKEYHWMVKLPVPDPSRRALVRGMRAELKEVNNILLVSHSINLFHLLSSWCTPSSSRPGKG